jgi:hypothetical protein
MKKSGGCSAAARNGVTCHQNSRCVAARTRSSASATSAPLIAGPHALVYTKGDGLWNAQHAVDASSRSVPTEDHDARRVQKQAPDEVVAHSPERGQLLHREMPLERDLGGRRAFMHRQET